MHDSQQSSSSSSAATASSGRRMNFRQRKIDVDRPLPIIFLKTENDEQELEEMNLVASDSSTSSKSMKRNSSTTSGGGGGGSGGTTDEGEKMMNVPIQDMEELNRVIPIPPVIMKENMDYVNVHHFDQPRFYIRYLGRSFDEESTVVEYDLDADDFEFIERTNARFQQQQQQQEEVAQNNKTQNNNSTATTEELDNEDNDSNHHSTEHTHHHHHQNGHHDTNNKHNNHNDNHAMNNASLIRNHYRKNGRRIHSNARQSTNRTLPTHIDMTLSEDTLEACIDRFEKTTGFNKTLCSISDAIKHYPSLSKVAPKLLHYIYSYWKEKRLKRVFKQDGGLYKTCGKPLLEEYVLQPDMDDTNPALAFRPRERAPKKQRKNDLDAYQRLQQLRGDFVRLRQLMQDMHHRETLKHNYCKITRQILLKNLCGDERESSVISPNNEAEANNEENQSMKQIAVAVQTETNKTKNKRKANRPDGEEQSRKRVKRYKEEKVKEINLLELVKAKPTIQTPVFSFLVSMRKTGGFEGDEIIDSLTDDLRETPKCYLGRGGRIIFEQPSVNNEATTPQSRLESVLLQQEKVQYRKLAVSNQKREMHKFAREDDFGFEDPDEEDDDDDPGEEVTNVAAHSRSTALIPSFRDHTLSIVSPASDSISTSTHRPSIIDLSTLHSSDNKQPQKPSDVPVVASSRIGVT